MIKKLPVKQWYERKVVRSRRSICKPLNINRYDSCDVCEIYHGLRFFLEKHSLGFGIYSQVIMEIRVSYKSTKYCQKKRKMHFFSIKEVYKKKARG